VFQWVLLDEAKRRSTLPQTPYIGCTVACIIFHWLHPLSW